MGSANGDVCAASVVLSWMKANGKVRPSLRDGSRPGYRTARSTQQAATQLQKATVCTPIRNHKLSNNSLF
jgi:hypothetical protein